MEVLPPEQEPLPVREPETGTGVLARLDKGIVLVSKVLLWIAGAGLVAMLALVVADVIGIKIFSTPVPGGIEFVTFFAVIAIAFSVAYTQAMRGHVAVDFIAAKFPRRLKLVTDGFTMFLSTCLFGAMAWYSFKYGNKLRDTGEVSMTQNIPFYPFVYAMGVCFLVTLLVLIMDFVKVIRKAAEQWTR